MVMFLAVLVFGGYLLPLPCTVMSWREWLRIRATDRRSGWRHAVSTTALVAVTLAIPLWAYAAVRELRNDYSYIYLSAQIGRWSSFALVLLSSLAVGRCRTCLVLTCIGLLLFYGVTIGEMP